MVTQRLLEDVLSFDNRTINILAEAASGPGECLAQALCTVEFALATLAQYFYKNNMARVTTSLLLLFYMDFCIESLPIKSGFSVKFKPLFTRDEIHPKTFGTLFAKISQDFSPEAVLRQQIFSKAMPPPSPKLGTGCTNQLARLALLTKYNKRGDNNTHPMDTSEYFSLPIIKQPFKDYKVLVATAPPDIKIGRGDNSKNLVIYVIFNEGSSGEDSGDMVKVPEIYFVNKPSDKYDFESKDKPEPKSIFLIDNNRTVTGLKSRQVEKFLRFRNRLINRYNYEIVP